MEELTKEIQKFISVLRIVDRWKMIHTKNLGRFANYLANGLEVPSSDVHLSRIYCIRDLSGNTIRHKPLDSRILDDFMHSLLPCNYNTLLTSKTSLSIFLKWLERIYDFPNPMKNITFNINIYNKHTRPPRALSRHEVLRFFHSLVQHSEYLKRDLLLFCLLASTGCRITEILSLRASQLNFENETITLPKTKSKKPQIVILRKGMGMVLYLYCKHYKMNNSDPLFTAKDKNMTYGQAAYLFKKLLRLANITQVNLHTTRHSFATHLFENGADISIIQQLLRHADLQVTMDYIHNNAIRNQGMKNKQNDELYRMLK